MLRGTTEPPSSVLLLTAACGVMPVVGGTSRPNEVLWWHHCPGQDGWIACGLAAHTLTGTAEAGDLTIRASLICSETPGCNLHGWITDMRWTDA